VKYVGASSHTFLIIHIINVLYTEHIIGFRLTHRGVIPFEFVPEEDFVRLECLVVIEVQSRQFQNTYNKAMTVCCRFLLIPVRTHWCFFRSNKIHELNKSSFQVNLLSLFCWKCAAQLHFSDNNWYTRCLLECIQILCCFRNVDNSIKLPITRMSSQKTVIFINNTTYHVLMTSSNRSAEEPHRGSAGPQA
jgi:hypothetical protein